MEAAVSPVVVKPLVSRVLESPGVVELLESRQAPCQQCLEPKLKIAHTCSKAIRLLVGGKTPAKAAKLDRIENKPEAPTTAMEIDPTASMVNSAQGAAPAGTITEASMMAAERTDHDMAVDCPQNSIAPPGEGFLQPAAAVQALASLPQADDPDKGAATVKQEPSALQAVHIKAAPYRNLVPENQSADVTLEHVEAKTVASQKESQMPAEVRLSQAPIEPPAATAEASQL